MKKKVLFRCLVGAPIGLAISTLITIVISLIVGDGNYYPVVPELVTDCGNEINAVLLQALCSVLYGVAWGACSIIWEKDDWSLFRQTVTHLMICSLTTLPIAYLMQWMEHNIFGLLSYFGIFFGIYLFIWLSQYFAIKRRLRQINAKVHENNSEEK